MEAFTAKLESTKEEVNKCLNDKNNPCSKWMQLLEEKTNIPRLYLFLGIYLYSVK